MVVAGKPRRSSCWKTVRRLGAGTGRGIARRRRKCSMACLRVIVGKGREGIGDDRGGDTPGLELATDAVRAATLDPAGRSDVGERRAAIVDRSVALEGGDGRRHCLGREAATGQAVGEFGGGVLATGEETERGEAGAADGRLGRGR